MGEERAREGALEPCQKIPACLNCSIQRSGMGKCINRDGKTCNRGVKCVNWGDSALRQAPTAPCAPQGTKDHGQDELLLMLSAVGGRAKCLPGQRWGFAVWMGEREDIFCSSGADVLNFLQRELVFSFPPLFLELKSLPSPVLFSPLLSFPLPSSFQRSPSLPCLACPPHSCYPLTFPSMRNTRGGDVYRENKCLLYP